MKKFIILLTSIFFTDNIPLNVVSCKKNGAQIQLIMDGKGAVDDHSFNQLVWEGVKDYGRDNKKTTSFANAKDVGWEMQSAKEEQYREYRKAYDSAFDSGAEIIVANGFFHSVSITDFALQNRKKPVVLVDATLNKHRKMETKDLNNVASLLFKSEQASFVAGIIACAYLNKNKAIFLDNDEKGTVKKLAFGSFGGSNVASVVNYMAGLHVHTTDEINIIMRVTKIIKQ